MAAGCLAVLLVRRGGRALELADARLGVGAAISRPGLVRGAGMVVRAVSTRAPVACVAWPDVAATYAGGRAGGLAAPGCLGRRGRRRGWGGRGSRLGGDGSRFGRRRLAVRSELPTVSSRFDGLRPGEALVGKSATGAR